MLTAEIGPKLEKSTKTTSLKLSAANNANNYGAREMVSIATCLKSLPSTLLMGLIWLAHV